jgi:uncharacterized iron-regulated membrane protein
MTFRKLIGNLHLWLGLSSGLLVLIIALTGCLYAFQSEISDLTQPYRFVEAQSAAFMPPSRLEAIARQQLPDKHVHSVHYTGSTRAAQVSFYSFDPDYYYIVYLDPYTGQLLKVKDMNRDFFRVVLMGHFYLWLPPAIGQPIVASATLVFVVMLITGLILWWPRNKAATKQRFRIQWSARWRRKNYDLHQVLGFYSTWIVIILALTGLVWGFQWFAKTTYWATSGGKTLLPYQEPSSDTTRAAVIRTAPAIDQVWGMMKAEYPGAENMEVHIPEQKNSPIVANINPDPSTYWKIDYRYFDQYTLRELSVDHQWGRFKKASAADKLARMNYDIHVGAIGGFAGKLLAFLASLVVASLPVTGFCIWRGRRKKDKCSEKVALKRKINQTTPAVQRSRSTVYAEKRV